MKEMQATIEITREDFEAYVQVQKSGVTNMWAVNFVCDLSGLEREQCFYIMKHYDELATKYPGIADS